MAAPAMAAICRVAFRAVTGGSGGNMWKRLGRKGFRTWVSKACFVVVAVCAVAVVVTHAGSAGRSQEFIPDVVSAPSAQQLWVLGRSAQCSGHGACRQLEHSGDGGRSWQRLSTPAAAKGLTFVDAVDGWVYNGNGLWRTRDGGRSWEQVARPAVAGDDLVSYVFENPRSGWAFDDGSLWSTHDGGGNWTLDDIPGRFWSVALGDGVVRVASIDSHSELFVSTSPFDTGQWTTADLGKHATSGGSNIPKLYASGSAAWLVMEGRTGGDGMRLVGDQWQPLRLPECGGNGVGDLNATSPDTVLILCGRPGPVNHGRGERLFVSTDGGADFVETSTDIWPEEVEASLCGSSPDPVVVALSEGRPGGHRGRLISLTDNGRHWATAYVGQTTGAIDACHIFAAGTGYALEDHGTSADLLMTYSDGTAWNPVTFAE